MLQVFFLVQVANLIPDLEKLIGPYTKTISGEEWINEYIKNLNEDKKKEVNCSETECRSLFRFGIGMESKSIKTVNIPTVNSK